MQRDKPRPGQRSPVHRGLLLLEGEGLSSGRRGARSCMSARRSGQSHRMSARQERRLAGGGWRWVAIGAPLVVIGIVIALLLNGNALGIGVAIAVLGAI